MSIGEECCVCFEDVFTEEENWMCWQCKRCIHTHCELDMAEDNMNFCPNCQATKCKSEISRQERQGTSRPQQSPHPRGHTSNQVHPDQCNECYKKYELVCALLIIGLPLFWFLGHGVLSVPPRHGKSLIHLPHWSFIQDIETDNVFVVIGVGFLYFIYIGLWVVVCVCCLAYSFCNPRNDWMNP